MTIIAAYQVLYPWAVFILAITSAVMTVIAGGAAWVSCLTVPRDGEWRRSFHTEWGFHTARVILGAVFFIGSNLAAMLILRIGSWAMGAG